MEKSSEHDLKMVRKHHIHGSLQEEKSNKHPQFYQKRGMMSYSLWKAPVLKFFASYLVVEGDCPTCWVAPFRIWLTSHESIWAPNTW